MSKQLKFNVRLLRRVQRKILAEPKQFDMSVWQDNTECGTERCIGGWAIVLSGGKLHIPRSIYSGYKIQSKAMRLLGIEEHEAQSLFLSHNWPVWFKVKYNAARNAHSHPRMALWASKYIDWFIARKQKGLSVTDER